MSLKKLDPGCAVCSRVAECKNKKFVAVGYLEESMEDAAMPVLRETVNTIVDGQVVKVYKDEIEKQFQKALYSQLGLSLGV